MTNYNTMRFLTDGFNPFIRHALLVSQVPVNLSNFNILNQITVQGNEPSGSKRRFLFKMDNKIYKFDGQNLVEYSGAVDLDSVLQNGNSAAQIEAVRNNRQLVGKNIFPIIALYTDVQDAPTAKLLFNASKGEEILDHSYTFNHNFDGTEVHQFLDLQLDAEIVGDASAQALIALKPTADAAFSDYMTIEQARGQTAVHWRVKLLYHVDAVNGTNAAKITRCQIFYSKDINFTVYGYDAYIYSLTKYCVRNLSGAVLVVRHDKLDYAQIDADVSFQVTRSRAASVALGSIDTAEKSFTLEHDFFPGTLRIFIDGVETTDFTFDTANRSVTLPANSSRSSAEVTADYTAPFTDEVWLPMVADLPQPTNSSKADAPYTTRFALPNQNADSDNLTTGVFRLKLSRRSFNRHVSQTATGEPQSLKLTYPVDTISADADDWEFDYDSNTISFTSTKNSTVNINYTWHTEAPVVRGWSIVYSAVSNP